MKKITAISAALSAVLASSAANAQNADWTGPYVGVYAGVNAGKSQPADYWGWSAYGAPQVNATDVAVGGTIGFNKQVDDNFVLGLEADFGTGFDGKLTTQDSATQDTYVYDWKAKQKWNATVRARAGLAVNKTLAYLTGGLAVADADLSAGYVYGTAGDNSNDARAAWSGTQVGYVLGGGIEHKLTDAFSVKVEYLHSEYAQENACYSKRGGSEPYFAECASTGNTDSVYWNNANDSVRLGVNYKF